MSWFKKKYETKEDIINEVNKRVKKLVGKYFNDKDEKGIFYSEILIDYATFKISYNVVKEIVNNEDFSSNEVWNGFIKEFDENFKKDHPELEEKKENYKGFYG